MEIGIQGKTVNCRNENRQIQKYGNIEIWKLGNRKYGNEEIKNYGSMEIWKYGNKERV